MILSKNEEPFFHNWLSVVKTIFKETNSKKILLYGDGQRLNFMSGNYAGNFEYQTDRLDCDYYCFDNCAYEISILPNDDIKLEELKNYPCSDSYLETVKTYFFNISGLSQHCLELFKDDNCKIAKILESTHHWLNDSDLKYINKFKKVDVYTCMENNQDLFSMYNQGKYNHEYILVRNELECDGGQTIMSMSLIFNVIYNPRTNTYSQQKIIFYEDENVQENNKIHFDDPKKISEQNELNEMIDNLENKKSADSEVNEDDFDPMLA